MVWFGRRATATSASATSRSRSRFSPALLALGLTLVGCGDDDGRAHDVVARVAGEGQSVELERSVVEHVAARDDVDEHEARARALATSRLVAARRAELAAAERPPEHPDDLDPARRAFLERRALVDLWLDEVFEPSHRAQDIPEHIVEQNMADPAMTRRLFHPQLYFVCQALVMPAQQDDEGRHLRPPSEPEAAAAWQAAAGEAFAPLVARARALEPDLLGEDGDCSLFGRLVGVSRRTFPIELPAREASAPPETSEVTIRFERFAFAPSQAETFDPAWVEAVTAATEPGIVGPFATQFGLHLVIVGKIEPARLADGSLAPDELRAAREAALRDEIEQVWRANELQQTLAEARDRRVVRLSPELEKDASGRSP